MAMIAALGKDERAMNRGILAKWAEGVMLELAEKGLEHLLDMQRKTTGGGDDRRPSALISAADVRAYLLTGGDYRGKSPSDDSPTTFKDVDGQLLARIKDDGPGDPNPVYVPGGATEATVLDLMRKYVADIAQFALVVSRSGFADVEFHDEDAHGVDAAVRKFMEKKLNRLAYDLAQKWSWKAMHVYMEGADTDDEDEDEDEDEESEDGELEGESGDESDGSGSHKRRKTSD